MEIFNFLASVKISYQRKPNTIELSGISCKEIANGLFDAGYTVAKTDSNFRTVKTEFKEGTGKNKWMKLRLFMQKKGSTASIAGEWYNSLVIETRLLG